MISKNQDPSAQLQVLHLCQPQGQNSWSLGSAPRMASEGGYVQLSPSPTGSLETPASSEGTD